MTFYLCDLLRRFLNSVRAHLKICTGSEMVVDHVLGSQLLFVSAIKFVQSGHQVAKPRVVLIAAQVYNWLFQVQISMRLFSIHGTRWPICGNTLSFHCIQISEILLPASIIRSSKLLVMWISSSWTSTLCYCVIAIQIIYHICLCAIQDTFWFLN